jgi:F0F1-type ATP synthase assembly protein I
MADDQLPSKNSEDPAKSGEPKPAGWMNDLARRSTGLPEYESSPEPTRQKGDRSIWSLAGLGIQFAVTAALFAFMGHALDVKMGWSPWGLVSLVMIAVIGNMYLLIKESLKEDRPSPRRDKKK